MVAVVAGHIAGRVGVGSGAEEAAAGMAGGLVVSHRVALVGAVAGIAVIGRSSWVLVGEARAFYIAQSAGLPV